ncbi:Octaprenyl-diphosphate synthase / Dimethylallyltransferase / Geranyltranstransferase [Rubellimicrobium mesophilum DSM 19309]|uniref:Geranylgeranyl diphosphate synthase n=1 Tax=Rubellimicrobium mesophilum DSM 19309 TaxID=442562 RepID=A0A017HM17_9RHOB|nr:farnesyl diphosphate synthase [Rubellimicrobium mesophilum]EYD75203.1 Octaprenyl-diphosphate synthase / Dimethylallyltransferase / Geranyltranstransferase [Rubellimicrobium mesophilum DSM 19309]
MEAGALQPAAVGTMSFEAALSRARDVVEAELRRALAGEDGPVARAMLYACEGGKGLRGFLVLEGARLHGLSESRAAPVAAAIEALHAYSLIHDDLPCMDDDDLRRGRPTVHRQWDEATAVLAGDALQSLAFELVARAPLPPEARATLVLTLAQAAGVRGMVGGQALDIAAETAPAPLTLDQITALQARKTGALITWSAAAGARMAGADTAPLLAYGDALGLAFQIADDLLDMEGDAATVGKATHKDAAAGKATFVSLLGLDAARSRANSLVQQACDALALYGAEADTLREAARFVTSRRK